MTDVTPAVQLTLPDAVAALPQNEVLLSYQRELIELIIGHPVVISEKSRRIGMTWGVASYAAIVAAAARSAGGMDVMYVGYNLEMAREFVDVAAMWSRAFHLLAQGIDEAVFDGGGGGGDEGKAIDRAIKAFRIGYRSGHEVMALSSRPRSLRGKQGFLIIDEAAFHDDLQELLKAALAFLIWGGKVLVISTHDGEENPFNQLIKDCRAGKLPYAVHHCTFADALAQGLYRRICLVQGQEWSAEAEVEWEASIRAQYGAAASEELDCIPRASSGAYFTRSMIEQCQQPGIPIVRLSRSEEYYLSESRLDETREWCESVLKPILDGFVPNRRCTLGQDFGRDGNLSGIWILQDESGGRWATRLIIELRRLPFDCQQLILFWIIDHLPLFWGAKLDGRGNGQWLAETAQQRYGLSRVESVKATPEWYATHFPPYRAAYEDRSISVPEGEDVIADHRLVELVKGRPTVADREVKGSDGEARHGDLAIAGLLAWSATRESMVPAEFAAAGQPRESFNPFADGEATTWGHGDDVRLSWTGY